MQRYYKDIITIHGMPIEQMGFRICPYIKYNGVRSHALNSNIVSECNSIESIYLYINKLTGEPMSFLRAFDTPFEIVEVTRDEAISYLLFHENGISFKDNQRMKSGWFAEGNKFAYRKDISPALICALKKLGLTVSEIATLLEVSRTTVYARLRECEK